MFGFDKSSKTRLPPSLPPDGPASKSEPTGPPAASGSVAKACSTDDEDLLTECEAAEFEASVLAARNRRAAQNTPATSPVSEESAPDSEIEWAEQKDVYGPARGDAAQLAHALVVTPRPRLKHGEHLVFIRSSALEAARTHVRTDLHIELGGLLIGKALYDSGLDLFVVTVELALPALHGEGTATSFSYTPASWQELLPELKQMEPDCTIVGSYHSHPGLGVFLSSTDRETQADVFPHDWQVALVIDPIAESEGYFMGVSGRPCPAHVVDAAGKKMPSETR